MSRPSLPDAEPPLGFAVGVGARRNRAMEMEVLGSKSCTTLLVDLAGSGGILFVGRRSAMRGTGETGSLNSDRRLPGASVLNG